ncbi:deoxyribonuclease V [Saccharopolyspora antimicrobica]|uniref:Endonuclease V n=1 Tax=Saccharopolyspora antimicrobica TaxID=455193 RepID=A0A1I4Z279_9PSEU|nr:endonuclease V [Saccharopolyspora antimicrobica]RKT82900.1 endonuclease V [Saccharopolyspora antimicrobica]SFN44352.1 deoxyribonuclease V [Saccharopolyspora antimicrobica]
MIPHEWPKTESEAVAIQERLRPLVRIEEPPPIRTAAGLDVAYRDEDEIVAAITVLDVTTLSVVDSAVVRGKAEFPYIPGLFAFREAPPLLAALDELSVRPDVLVCDGQGLAHPRRFGLACHLGVLTGLPAIGVGKTAMGSYEPPGEERGEWSPLHLDDEVVGRALRTQSGVKPVFVSVGHRCTLDAACELVLRLTPKYRLPETTRTADHLGRMQP